MEKEFDIWNEAKKQINGDEVRVDVFYHTREIWWIALGTNIGFEQDGTGTGHQRPALILKGFSKSVCLIVPLTTSNKRNRYYVSAGIIDGKEAAAIISQIRLVDTRRLINRIGLLEHDIFESIRKAVKDML